MSDPFAAALVALHRGPGSVAAVFTSFGGAPLPDPIRVIRNQKTEDMQFGDTNIPVPSSIYSILRADVATPRARDTLMIGDEVFTIVGTPRLDDEGLSWTVEAPPA